MTNSHVPHAFFPTQICVPFIRIRGDVRYFFLQVDSLTHRYVRYAPTCVHAAFSFFWSRSRMSGMYRRECMQRFLPSGHVRECQICVDVSACSIHSRLVMFQYLSYLRYLRYLTLVTFQASLVSQVSHVSHVPGISGISRRASDHVHPYIFSPCEFGLTSSLEIVFSWSALAGIRRGFSSQS